MHSDMVHNEPPVLSVQRKIDPPALVQGFSVVSFHVRLSDRRHFVVNKLPGTTSTIMKCNLNTEMLCYPIFQPLTNIAFRFMPSLACGGKSLEMIKHPGRKQIRICRMNMRR